MDDHHGGDPWTVGRQQRISPLGNSPYNVPVARPLAIALRGVRGVKPRYMSAPSGGEGKAMPPGAG